MLQEVHCEKENIPMKLAEWGYQGLFSCYSNSKAGVCVLFNNNFNLQVQKAFCDPGGRFIVCDIKVEQMNITLANIYATNNDDPGFFQRFFERLRVSVKRGVGVAVHCSFVSFSVLCFG